MRLLGVAPADESVHGLAACSFQRGSKTAPPDDSLEDADNLPAPEVIAQEIIEDLEATLTEFTAVAQSLAKEDEA
jgi:hypothetical protein